jgi:hypothetical protein
MVVSLDSAAHIFIQTMARAAGICKTCINDPRLRPLLCRAAEIQRDPKKTTAVLLIELKPNRAQ